MSKKEYVGLNQESIKAQNIAKASKGLDDISFVDVLWGSNSEDKDVTPLYRDQLKNRLHKNQNLNIESTVPSEIIGLKNDSLISASYYKEGAKVDFLIILESKTSKNFRVTKDKLETLLQVLCYLKRINDNPEKYNVVLPKMIMLCSVPTCLILPVSYIRKYLSYDIKGLNSPSTAHSLSENSYILEELIKDENIAKATIYDIDKTFKMDVVAKRIVELARDTNFKLIVEEKNILLSFEQFSKYVVKSVKNEEEIPDRKKNLFIEMLLNPSRCELNSQGLDEAIFGKYGYHKVNRSEYIAFKSLYDFTNYIPEEELKFTEICDRLIEENKRRTKGEFYTPQIWVNESIKLLDEQLGKDWKEEYIVWDNSCGTKQLTRGSVFKELYSSTLVDGDLQISERYNPEGLAFQYDFLNDDVELFEGLRLKKEQGYVLKEEDFKYSVLYNKAPNLIRGLLSGKKLLYFINPPYASAKNGSKKKGDSKKDLGTSNIKTLMIKEKVNGQVTNLYVEFLFRITRIMELFDIHTDIGVFCPPLYLSGESNKKFREYIFDKFSLNKGFLFSAGHFADTNSDWGIGFSLLKCGRNSENSRFVYNIKDIVDVEIKEIGTKVLYNLDNKEKCSDWVREKVEKINEIIDYPYTSSGLVVKEKGYSKMRKGGMGTFYTNSNSIGQNNQGVALFSGVFTGWSSISINDINFLECCTLFTARRLISGKLANWVNWQDEYMIPNMEHQEYKRFEVDSVVYSLFNPKSNQSSLRGVDYNDKQWDIPNHFFFMSKDEIKELASSLEDRQYMNTEILNDINRFGLDERYTYNMLQELENELSPTARLVLEQGRKLVRLSFKYRKDWDKVDEYHLNTWDAGYYQLKGLIKDKLKTDSLLKDEFKKFEDLYSQLSQELIPLVYDLGFLYS